MAMTLAAVVSSYVSLGSKKLIKVSIFHPWDGWAVGLQFPLLMELSKIYIIGFRI